MELRTKTLEDSIVKRAERGGHTWIEAHPGDGTRYVLCFTDLDELPGSSKATTGGEGFVLVTSMADSHSMRSMCVGKDSLLHWTRVEERLGSTMVSSVTLAELIAHVIGCRCVSRDEFQRDHG